MRHQSKNESPMENRRRSFWLTIGLLLILGIGILWTCHFYVTRNSSNRKETVSVQDERGTPDMKHQVSSPSSPGQIALQKAIVAQIARIQGENKMENSEEAQEATAEDEERENEIAVLRKALPDNMLIPGKKTEAELREQMDSIEEQQFLRNLVSKNEATPNDLNRFYELKAKQFRDEIGILDFCENNAMEANAQGASPLAFCSDLLAHGADIRRANESAMAMLQQEFDNGFREQPVMDGNSRRVAEAQSSQEANPSQEENRR